MARSRYIYLVYVDDIDGEWAFTVKHEAVGAIHRSGYAPARVTMCRTLDGLRELTMFPLVYLDVQEELIKGGYRTKEG